MTHNPHNQNCPRHPCGQHPIGKVCLGCERGYACTCSEEPTEDKEPFIPCQCVGEHPRICRVKNGVRNCTASSSPQKEPVEGWVKDFDNIFLYNESLCCNGDYCSAECSKKTGEKIKAFISSLLEAERESGKKHERERILREMPNDTELLEIWVGFWRTFTHNNKRPPNMRESLSQMNSIIGQFRAIITKEQKP